MFSEFDRLAMTRALALAERGLETTHPNPRVGCVLAQGERIIAEGWHERAGEAHAEVAALRAAKEPVAGATAYVTLEPCSHYGRTPPCVNALIEARIARVVFAVQDPNPSVSGQGADALLRAGIAVEAGLMEAEATELNIGFMKRMKQGLPWVRVKLAMSLDGRTALANGASQWITGEHARNDVQRWRARCSAVMTGVGTVLADDPQLNVRTVGFKGRQPLRVVLDSRLRSPPGAKMFVGLGAPGGAFAGIAPGASGAGLMAASGTGDARGASVAGPAGAAAGRATTGAADGAAGSGGAGAARGVSVASPAGAAAGHANDAAAAGGGAVSANAGARIAAGAGMGAASGGDVLIFAAVGGGVPTAGPASSVVPTESDGPSDSAELAEDMAALVNAFETSPAAVAVRSADVAGPASVKTSPGPASAKASVKSEAPPTGGVSGAASPGGGGKGTGAAGAGTDSLPDDATWAGAALSGAVAVGAVQPKAQAVATGAPLNAPGPADGFVREPSGQGASALSGVSGAEAVPKPTYASTTDPAPSTAASAAPTTAVLPSTAPAAAAIAGPAAVPVVGGPGAASVSATPVVVPRAAAADGRGPSGAPGSKAHAVGVAAPAATKSTGAPASPPPADVPADAASDAKPSAGPVIASAASPLAPKKTNPPMDSPVAFQARRAALAASGVRIEEVPADDGLLDLSAVLQKLAQLDVNEVLVEAGPTLAGQLLATFFVDELLLYIAPKLLGPQGRPLVNLPELQSLQDAWGFALFDAKRFGDDLRLRLRPK